MVAEMIAGEESDGPGICCSRATSEALLMSSQPQAEKKREWDGPADA